VKVLSWKARAAAAAAAVMMLLLPMMMMGVLCWSTPAGIEGQNESSFRFDPMRWVETMVAEPERPCPPDMQVCVRVRLEEAFVSAVLLQNKRASLQRARRHGQPKCQDSRNPGLESLP